MVSGMSKGIVIGGSWKRHCDGWGLALLYTVWGGAQCPERPRVCSTSEDIKFQILKWPNWQAFYGHVAKRLETSLCQESSHLT